MYCQYIYGTYKNLDSPSCIDLSSTNASVSKLSKYKAEDIELCKHELILPCSFSFSF